MSTYVFFHTPVQAHPVECTCFVQQNMGENQTFLYANNKGTDQPVHLHRLIITFVIHSRESLLSYDLASGSEITPCNKIDKPLVVYRFRVALRPRSDCFKSLFAILTCIWLFLAQITTILSKVRKSKVFKILEHLL